jgi:hypothetical protein
MIGYLQIEILAFRFRDVCYHYNQIQSNTIKYNQIQSNTIKYNQIQSNTIKYNQIQSNTIKSNQIQSNPITANACSHILGMTMSLTCTYESASSDLRYGNMEDLEYVQFDTSMRTLILL